MNVRLPSKRLRVPGVLTIAICLVGCSTQSGKQVQPNIPLAAPTLSYPITINSVEGTDEIIAAGTTLPTMFSDKYASSEENQDIANIVIAQKLPAGSEKIVDVDVPLPPQKENTVNIIVSVRIDQAKLLRVKASVMESGVVKEYGPFPVN